VLAKVSKLDDDKIYTSLQEVPEEGEDDKNGEIDDIIDGDNNNNDEEVDSRSYYSEEAIKPEE
jgi:hypothetical protein